MSFLGKFTNIFKKGVELKKAVGQKQAKPVKSATAKKTPVVKLEKIRKISSHLIEEAKARAREIIVEAKDEALKIRTQASDQVRATQANIDKQLGALEEKEKILASTQKQLEFRLQEIDKIKKQQLEKLERAGSLTTKEAKELILKATEEKLTEDMAKQIREAEEQAQQEADEKAKAILVDAMYRGAIDYVPEYTVSAVKLTDEDMKGRIIGKEGRNIRTFEKVTGVDVDLDEEGVIRLSSFDSIRREIARVALEKLIADGRIQPTRIEEIVDRIEKDVNRIILKSGEDLCHQAKVYNLPLEIIKTLGRFKYRFSYGQNMIAHTLEETKIGVHLAYEAGANVNVVRLGCLLHDIGKVITDEEGSHVQIGVDFLTKYNIPQPVLDCIAQHHEDQPFSSKEAILVYIADAISGSRPGARYEDYGEYVKRLTKLEDLAVGFKGVEKAYAIQAGREIRVIASPEKLTDAACTKLAKDLKDKIQKELTYPGQVKVNVIRELRTTEIAK